MIEVESLKDTVEKYREIVDEKDQVINRQYNEIQRLGNDFEFQKQQYLDDIGYKDESLRTVQQENEDLMVKLQKCKIQLEVWIL